MPAPLFSIVIPARNAAVSLPLLLHCLQQQDAPSQLAEILVVDDGSSDHTSEILARFRSRFPLTFWSHPLSLGRSEARNRAWRHSTGEIVLFLDADMLPEPDWLSGYAEAFSASKAEVISGGRYCVVLGGEPSALKERLGELLGVSAEELSEEGVSGGWARLAEAAQLGQYPTPTHVQFETQLREVCRDAPRSLICAYSLVTSNVGVRRSWLEKVNGFDPFIRWNQDTDLGFRLWEAGARFGYATSSRAYHLYTAVGRDHPTDVVEDAAFLHRHPYLLVPLVYLWFSYHAPEAPPLPSPLFGSLPRMAQQGQALMEVDVAREFFRLHHSRLPADCQYSREAVAAYLVEITGIARTRAETYLDLAIEKGVLAQRRNGRVYLDLFHTLNWLRTRTTLREYDVITTNYQRTHKTAYFKSRRPEDLLNLQSNGVYEVSIDLSAIAGNRAHATLDIPIPIETEGQTNVRIYDVDPPDLLDYIDADTQLIRDYPLQAHGNEPILLRYRFSCQIHERPHCAATASAGNASVREADLNPTYPLTALTQLRSLLQRIPVEKGSTPTETARAFYLYVLNHTNRLQSTLPDFSIVTTGFGPCIHRVRLFVNLCRLMGIPARERCGAPFQGPVDPAAPSRLEIRERGFSPFLHTWAEFYDPSRGWTPVELMAWGCGERIMTSQNVTDPALRHELERDTHAFDDYYFGALDPYRIHCSSEVNCQAPYPVIEEAERVAQHKLFWHTRHRLSVELVANQNIETGN